MLARLPVIYYQSIKNGFESSLIVPGKLSAISWNALLDLSRHIQRAHGEIVTWSYHLTRDVVAWDVDHMFRPLTVSLHQEMGWTSYASPVQWRWSAVIGAFRSSLGDAVAVYCCDCWSAGIHPSRISINQTVFKSFWYGLLWRAIFIYRSRSTSLSKFKAVVSGLMDVDVSCMGALWRDSCFILLMSFLTSPRGWCKLVHKSLAF